MGMFTTAIYKGKKIQFKTGDDLLEELEVGDSTEMPDGIYEGVDPKGAGGGYLIVIYSGVLWAVRPWKEGLERVARELFKGVD